MSWIRKQIERLLAESRRRSRLLRVGAVAALAAVLVVTVALAQGATAASTGGDAQSQAGISIEGAYASAEGSSNGETSSSGGEGGGSAAAASTSAGGNTAQAESGGSAAVTNAQLASPSVASNAPAALAASNEPNPSKGTLTSATFSVTRSEGGTTNIASGTKVAANSRVQFALTFELTSGTLKSTDSTVTYTLPEGLSVDSSDAQGGDIIGSTSNPKQSGKKLGTYKIKDGKVILTYSNAEDATLFDEGITTTVTFWATVQNSSLTDERTINFDGKGSLIVEPTEPTLQVSKASSKVQGTDQWGNNTGDYAGGTNGTERQADYTITVGSTTGTGTTVTITDAFAGGSNVAAESYDTSTFKLVRYTSADDTIGTEVTGIANKLTTGESNGHATFSLTGLDALNAGERYVLTYRATVTEADHTADTREVNNVTAKTDNNRVTATGTATTQWGNTGDIHISKSGQLTDYVNPNNPKEKRIQYRIKVWSNKGTVTRIQIGDTANNTGSTNIDTSAWNSTASRNLFFDHNSFTLTKYPTTTDADNGTNGTDASSYLTNLSFGADGIKPSLGLSISEPLAAGECYILTYTATVTEIDDNAPDTRMNNQAVARIYPGGQEQHTNQANAGVEWHNEIQKSGTFNQITGYIDWNITVNRNYGDARGLAINDTLPEGSELVSNVRVYTSDRNGGGKSQTPVQTIDLLNASDNSVATDGVDNDPSTYDTSTRALHVVLGSWASANQPYTISFTTTAPADGTVSNQAYEVVNGTSYGSQGINVGVNRTTDWGINKTVGTNASDNYDISTGTYSFTWNATVTFPDQDLSPDTNDGVVKLHDVFGEVTDANGASSSDYTGLHYAVAKDLYAELTGSSNSGTTVTLRLHRDTDANGTTRTYTLQNGVFTSGSGDDAITLSGVRVVPTFYDAENNAISEPATSDAHVRSFDLVLTCDNGKTINGQSLTVTNYHSILDARTLPASTQVSAANSLSSNHTSGSSAQSQSVTTMSNPMEKQVRTLDDRADNSDTGFAAKDKFEKDWQSTASGDYDSISGKQHAAQFRIALNTVSYPDNAVVTITDTLPAGMVLATSTNNGTSSVNHPVRLVYGTNVGQSNASYQTVTGGALSYTTSTNGDGQQVITFTFDLSKTGRDKGQYYITYTASFVNDTAWSNPATAHRSYTNTASAQVGAVTYTDDATLNIDRTVSPVQKSKRGTLTNDRKGKYQVIINPAASDLDASSDTIELVDSLSGWNTGSNAGHMNPVLDLNSVHLYSYDNDASDGIGVEIPKASYSLKYEATDGTDGVRKLTVTVPDSTALILVYDYEFRATATGDWGSQTGGTGDFTATVSNTATLAGNTSETVAESVRRARSSASAASRALYVYKVDKDNYANTLDGSEFDLYSAAASATTWTKIDQPAGAAYTGGATSSGTFAPYVDDLTKATGVHEHNTLYALVETKAPTGYERTVRYLVWLDQNQTEDQAWTVLTGSTTDTAKVSQLDVNGNTTGTAVSRSDVTFIPYNGGSLYIEDEQTGITVTKNWKTVEQNYLASNDSDLPSSIDLQLKQSSDGGLTWTNYGDAVTVTKPTISGDAWQYTWARLPMSDGNGNNYTYKVEETITDAAEASHWKAKYIGDNDGKGINSGNITVTNTRQYSLPQTGGVPVAAVMGVGTALVAAAGIVLAIRRVAR